MKDEATFIDSNIWLYAFIDNGDAKHGIAAKLVREASSVIISSQVVSEVCVNMLKKARQGETFIQNLVADFHRRYGVVAIGEKTHLGASRLRERYSLSFWDSLICASALDAECTKLVSEDMQDGLVIEGRLEIVNPFRVA